MNKKEYFFLGILGLISVIFGTLYSIYNTDPHHWGFIAGMAKDAIQNKSFFTETYLQYGAGQSILFKAFNYFIPMNYTSIGILSSIVYAITLVFLYLGTKKIANAGTAFFCTLLAFLMHSFSIYPWPDYEAGLCLAIACFIMIEKDADLDIRDQIKRSLMSGLFLFLAFLFRNTYLLSLIATGATYFGLCFYRKSFKNKNLTITLSTCFVLIFSYLGFLYADGTLGLWYGETIGAGSSQYGIGIRSILTLLERVFLLKDLNNAIVSVLFYVALITGFTLMFKPNDFKSLKTEGEKSVLLLFILLGLFGISQATLGYEMFRIQNACFPLYLVFAFYIAEKLPGLKSKSWSLEAKIVISVLFISLAMKFPHRSSLYPIYAGNLSEYHESEIPYYQGHQFRKPASDYYTGLVKLICAPGKKIVNLTMDSSIPFLCGENRNVLSLPFFNIPMISRTNPEELKRIMKSEFAADEIIVANSPPNAHESYRLTEVGRVEKPEEIWSTGDTHPVFVYTSEKIK